MKLISLSRGIVLIFVAMLPFLTSCYQKVDIFVYPDESWQVQSNVELEQIELVTINLIEDQLAELIKSIVEENLVSNIEFTESTISGLLDILEAHYANLGIDFQWSGSLNRYRFSVKGKNLDQFEQLLPGAISIQKESNSQYRLMIDLPKLNVIAAMVYKQEITLHVGKAISHNAPQEQSNKITWTNPVHMEAVFIAVSPPPWGVIVSSIFFFSLVIIIIIVALKKRSSSRIDATIYNES